LPDASWRVAARRRDSGDRPDQGQIAGLLGLDKLFGDGAGICTRMQAAYVTWHAERKEDVSKIPTIRARAA
jgi:hypothetical protein